MTAAIRKQIQRSKEAAKGLKRIELTLTPEEQKLLGPRPAQALKARLKAELEKAWRKLGESKVTDPYVWIDPFEEVARANSRAAYAREQGRNDILEIEAQQPGLMRAAIEDQAYKLAERVVRDQIRPTIHEAMTQRRIRDASLDLLSFTPLRHVVAAADIRTISPVYDIQDQAILLRTEVRVVRPFEYAMQTML